MVRRVARCLFVAALGLGVLAGPGISSSSAAPCPPGSEWDPIAKTCIIYDTD